MNDPDFVTPGDPIRTSTINDLVTAARSTTKPRPHQGGAGSRIFRPFDVIQAKKEGTSWKIKLKPSWFIDGATTDEITFGNEALSEYPEITVEDGRNLYLQRESRELTWESPGSSGAAGKLLILEIKKEGEKVQFMNKHPSVVSNGGGTSPFTPILTSKDGDYEVKLTPGVIKKGNGLKLEVAGIESPLAAGAGDKIYLEYDVTAETITFKVGSAWDGSPFEYDPTPPFNPLFHRLHLGELSSDSPPKLEAAWHSGNLVLGMAYIDGRLADILLPGSP